MSTPMDAALDAVNWVVLDNKPGSRGLPYATHSGVLSIGNFELRCYRLNDGRAILHADDVNAFFAGTEGV
jgi:hypothetical protein